MSLFWRNLGKSVRKKKSRKGYSGYSQKRRPAPTVTVTVEIARQSEKAILIMNKRGETAWIPKAWVIKKKELSENTWKIVIKKHQWEEKFSGKPKERLSPRSDYSKFKQKADLAATPTVTATVKIVRQTEKALLIKNNRGKTAWIPKAWVITKTVVGKHAWRIEIKKHQWEDKFPGKPKKK